MQMVICGKALRGDEGVHAQHQQHKHRAQNVDAAVTQRIGQSGRLRRCDFQTRTADRQYPDYPDGLC